MDDIKICPIMSRPNIDAIRWTCCQRENCMAWVPDEVIQGNEKREGWCKLIEK